VADSSYLMTSLLHYRRFLWSLTSYGRYKCMITTEKCSFWRDYYLYHKDRSEPVMGVFFGGTSDIC
jgi:hypothetical protein